MPGSAATRFTGVYPRKPEGTADFWHPELLAPAPMHGLPILSGVNFEAFARPVAR